MVYRRSPAVEETPVGERLVLYNRITGSAAVLSPTASILWVELTSERDRGHLEKVLIDKFPRVDPSRIKSDVESCLIEMKKCQLVSDSPGPIGKQQ